MPEGEGQKPPPLRSKTHLRNSVAGALRPELDDLGALRPRPPHQGIRPRVPRDSRLFTYDVGGDVPRG